MRARKLDLCCASRAAISCSIEFVVARAPILRDEAVKTVRLTNCRYELAHAAVVSWKAHSANVGERMRTIHAETLDQLR
jgi:hypothetical protein